MQNAINFIVKVSFYMPKGGLLHAQRWPFAY